MIIPVFIRKYLAKEKFEVVRGTRRESSKLVTSPRFAIACGTSSREHMPNKIFIVY
jgi:hypothetical protein